MAQRTSDRFARVILHWSSNGRNEPAGGDDSGVTCDNQYSDQRQPCLAGGEHAHRAFKKCASRVNSAAATAVRNAHPMVVGVVFILVEPTGHNVSPGSRATRKG